jgi:glycosyltransferase involved in cell wall biosynthesis
LDSKTFQSSSKSCVARGEPNSPPYSYPIQRLFELESDLLRGSRDGGKVRCMAKINVFKVLYHHRTQGRGVEAVHIRGVVDALRARGITVEMLSLPNADPYEERKVTTGAAKSPWRRIAGSLPEPIFELLEFGFSFLSFFRVWRWLSRHPDCRFIYERYSLFMFSTVAMARLRGVPVILEVNDSAAAPRVRGLFFLRLALIVEAWTFRNANGLIFISTDFKDICHKQYQVLSPSIVSHNAANIVDFTSPPGQRELMRRKYGLENSLVCGYLGAFIVWHQIDLFVQKIADRLDERKDLKFLLVGDGATYEAIREFVRTRKLESRIILVGRVPHSEVAGILSAMDFAVLPAAADYSSPVKLFEFMAAGIPAVAPDYSPVREILIDGENGWLFSQGNISAAVETVFSVSRDALKLKRVGATARDYIARERQWTNNIDQLLDLVGKVSPSSKPNAAR